MSQRTAYLFGFLIVLAILGMGFYLEYYEGIMPCPLCTLQRICFAVCGVLFFIGIFLSRKRLACIIINLLAVVFSGLGLGLAARQLWIQHFPGAGSGECGVSLNYMLSVLPIRDVAERVFSGSAECSQRGWEFLNLNIPEWSLLVFAGFIAISIYNLMRGSK